MKDAVGMLLAHVELSRNYEVAINQREAESMRKLLPWAVGFFFGNLGLSMELWSIISGISGFDD